jgi:transcriptional regulator with XRE-family HTH domain
MRRRVTVGSQKLRAIVREGGGSLSQAEVRERVRCAAGVITRLISGERGPSVDLANTIALEFDIPVSDWSLDVETVDGPLTGTEG